MPVSYTHLDVYKRQEIAERQRAEAEARRQRSTLLALINAIPDPIWFKDCDGVYRGCNPAFAAIFGRSPETVVGCRDEQLFDAELSRCLLYTSRCV